MRKITIFTIYKQKNQVMKKCFIAIVLIIANIIVYSQITTDTGLSINDLVTDTLINGCTSASDVSTNDGAYGYFTNGDSDFPFESGIILASGDISNAIGPNTSGGNGSSLGSGGDPDLQALLPSHTIYDATIVEFDFIPASDTIRFNYIFGSEEFPEYANSSFNDVFGFFLSGPGISGEYTNDAVNIAILPNGYPVTIDNVHNYDYYISSPGGNASSYNNAVQYDGNTIVLTAEWIVTACQEYHIKLAVGDAGDSSLDSGVFIEAGSFISGASIDVVNNAQVGDDADLWEGCENYYVVSREEGAETDEEVVIDIMIAPESDATSGVDFTEFPTEAVIEVGDMTDTIFYSAFNDGLDEGHETIIVAFYTACPCGNMSTAVYDTIWIYDAEFIKGGIQDVQTYYCGTEAPESVTLTGTCNIDPNVEYHWSTGEDINEIVVNPEFGATQYWLTMVDQCGNEVYDSITVRISDMEEIDHTIYDPSCYNECNGYLQMDMDGQFEPFTFTYVNSLYQYIPDSVHNTGLNTFGDLCPGTYKITATDNIGCFIRYEYTLENPPPVNLSAGILENDMKFCEYPGEITITAESNQIVPNFLWSTSESTSSITVLPDVGVNSYWVRILDNCGNYFQDEISIDYSNLTVEISADMDMGSCDGEVSAIAANGILPYIYYWQNPINAFGQTQVDLCTGTYELLVTDYNGCEITETIFVEEYNSVPQSYYDNIFTIYPNPSSDKFVIDFNLEDYENVNVRIVDIKGSIIFEAGLTDKQTEMSGFDNGIYFVELVDDIGIVAIQKLIITN